MKYIQLFEAFKKNYGQKLTHDQFKALKPGEKVLYMGAQYEIEKNEDVVLKLKSIKSDHKISVNYSMFNDKGAISEGKVNEAAATDLSREDLKKVLTDKYKMKFVKDTEDFDKTPNGIWLSAENRDKLPNGALIFDYYNESPNKYEFGVHKDFVKFLDKSGWTAEWYDPGTMMLFPN